MRKKWGGVFAASLILILGLFFPLSGYATENANLGEMVPLLIAYDEQGNPMQVMLYATPIIIDEQTTYFVTSSYMCEQEHSGGYAIFYYQNGEVVGVPVQCIYQNTDVGYALFETADGTSTGLGLACAGMDGISTDTLIAYMGYGEDGSLNLYQNYCSGYGNGVGQFAETCVEPAYGGPVFETNDFYVIGFIGSANIFVTMEQVYSDISGETDSGSSSETGGGTTIGDSGSGEEIDSSENGGEDSGNAIFPIVIIGGIVGGGIFLIARKKKKKEIRQSVPEQPLENQQVINPQAYVDTRPRQQEKIWSLIAIGGIHAGAVIPLTEPIVFGRDKNRCNLLFPSTTQGISNIHCQITIINGRIEITDLGSSYGTFLDDGTKIMPHVPYVLNSGQGFYLADRQYSYRIQ